MSFAPLSLCFLSHLTDATLAMLHSLCYTCCATIIVVPLQCYICCTTFAMLHLLCYTCHIGREKWMQGLRAAQL